MGFIYSVDKWADRCMSDPEWVAMCLQRLHRFGGQHPTSTVLAHSLEVWKMCCDLSPAEQMWALVHDAHEIISGEITRPFKSEETSCRQKDADRILKHRLGISDVDMSRVNAADTLHGDREAESLTLFCEGKITLGSLNDRDYSFGFHGGPFFFCKYFLRLKAKLCP